MSVIDSGFSGERGIFLRVVRICGGGSCEAFLVFENCDPPEEGDLYAAEEDTTVRIADTAPAGGETIYYMLMFTLKNKEARMTERIRIRERCRFGKRLRRRWRMECLRRRSSTAWASRLST